MSEVVAANNQITIVGGGFLSAPALSLLNFERNKLSTLPAELAALKKLKSLLLVDNPLESKLKKMLEKGGPKMIKDMQQHVAKGK